MSASVILRIAAHVGDPVGNLQVRYQNIVNTPIVSATWLDNGITLGDDYVLDFTKSGTVNVKTSCNVKNRYYDQTGKIVTCDGVTVNRGIIPNVGLVFSASVDTGWQANVSVGNHMESDGSTVAVLSVGVVESGTSTAGTRCAACNVGDAPAQQEVLYSLPGIDYYGSGWDAFVKIIQPHSSTGRHKMASPATKTITFADWKTGGGGKKTADIKVNGNVAVQDAIFDGSTVYEWGSGNGYDDANDYLQGLQIILADTVSDPSSITLTLKVLDGWDLVQFAPDVTGSPGTYANQDLTLTQAGQPTGTIQASGAAYFWARDTLPLAEQAGDMRGVTYMARGLTT